MKRRIRAALTPEPGHEFPVGNDKMVAFGPQFETVEDYLKTAYLCLSLDDKTAFRKVLGDIFAEYIAQFDRWRAAVQGPPVTLIYLIWKIGAYEQLPKVVAAFNAATLEREEVEEILFALFCVIANARRSALIREVLAQIVDGPQFLARYAIEALKIELEHHPRDVLAVIQKYAPYINATCVTAETPPCSDDDRRELCENFAELQEAANAPRLREPMNGIFRKYHTQPGDWMELVKKIVSN